MALLLSRPIWKKCNGIDNSPVIRYNEKKSISSERTFQKDTMNLDKLKSYLIGMAENLAFQLRNGNKLTACITVKIRYTDMQTYSKQRQIAYTSSDHAIIETVKELEGVDAVANAKTIGVTAGASTPEFLVDDVMDYLQSI